MRKIIVTTQAEFDALPNAFAELTRIYVKNDPAAGRLVVNKAWGNSSVEAWGNSSVEAWGNSSVEARENSSVEAWENSSVEAWGNSSVVARENSSVEAWGNSSVEAWGNSSVVARGNSSVEAWGNSSVVAWGNVVVRIFSKIAKAALHEFSVAFLPVTINLNIEVNSKHAHVQHIEDLGWFERNAVNKTKKIILYKRVSATYQTQENTKNETTWLVGSVVTHPNWAPINSECGGGKFHACSRPYFCDEFRSTVGDKYIAVEIAADDLHEWTDDPQYPHKIGFRAGKVLYECDRFGRAVPR
jgi:hypothetical protein